MNLLSLIPRSFEQWFKTFVATVVSAAANAGLASIGLSSAAAVGVNVKPLDAHQLGGVCLSGAIVGTLMYLAKNPVPNGATTNGKENEKTTTSSTPTS